MNVLIGRLLFTTSIQSGISVVNECCLSFWGICIGVLRVSKGISTPFMSNNIVGGGGGGLSSYVLGIGVPYSIIRYWVLDNPSNSNRIGLVWFVGV